jgi:molybdopterin-guanine dinucleotide biosynthesis protein A
VFISGFLRRKPSHLNYAIGGTVTNPYREITCFVLAGGRNNQSNDFTRIGDLTRLESGYRRYAKIFEKVTLVLKSEQARERYLNYPYVCDRESGWNARFGVETALENSDTELAFIGSSEIADFPPDLIVELVKNYHGESFLGYSIGDGGSCQPLFGLYNRRLADKLKTTVTADPDSLYRLVQEEGRLIPLPPNVSASKIGIR